MKTAISVPDDVFHEVDKVAKERHSSRSEVIVTALKEYLERRKSGNLLKALNEAYGTAETAEEYDWAASTMSAARAEASEAVPTMAAVRIPRSRLSRIALAM